MADALLWDAVCALLPTDPGAGPLDVLDLGGGTGGLAVPLAALGHRVTVVDSSPDALAALASRAAESGVGDRLVALQGDADDLQPHGAGDDRFVAAFDLALCHGLLEHVDDPAQALSGIARALRPGGRLSLVVAQRSAAVVAAALAGHLARAQALLDDPDGRWGEADPLTRRFDRARVVSLVTAAGLVIDDLHGLRVLADHVPGQLLEADPTALARLHELDARLTRQSDDTGQSDYSGQSDYTGLSMALHVLGRRPE